jgi:hypothetical protein
MQSPKKLAPLPPLKPGYAATGRFIDCPTCRHKLGEVWTFQDAPELEVVADALLVTNRAAQIVGATWHLGPVANDGSRLRLPAHVRCRKGHECSITLDGRARFWRAHPAN